MLGKAYLQFSGAGHQLRLVVYPMIYEVLYIQKVVSGISSINSCTTNKIRKKRKKTNKTSH